MCDEVSVVIAPVADGSSKTPALFNAKDEWASDTPVAFELQSAEIKDLSLIHICYDSMKHWVEFIESQCGENGLWQTGFQYGDWLGLDAEANALCDERKGATDDYLSLIHI